MKKFILALATTVSMSAASLTPVQTASYGTVEDGIFTDFGSSSFIGFNVPLTGFKKFDASLGTLERILFTLESEISATGTLEYVFESTATTPEEDENFGNFASITVDQPVQTDITYSDSPSTGVLAVSDQFSLIFSEDDVSVDESGYSTPDSTLIFEYFGSEQTVNEGPSTSSGALETFGISDFSGSPLDDVDALSVGFFVPIDEFSVSSQSDFGDLDPSEIFIDLTVVMQAGTGTLQYEYTPVPEPASAGTLLGLIALLGIFSRRSRS